MGLKMSKWASGAMFSLVAFASVQAQAQEDRIKQLQEDFERRMKQQQEEFNRRLKEQQEEFNRQMKEQKEDFKEALQKAMQEQQAKQTEKQVEGEAGKITAGWKDGFFIKSEDDQFEMSLHGFVQTDLRSTDNDNAAGNEFLIRRLRFWPEGKLWKYWEFKFQPDFSSSGSGVTLFEGWLNFHYIDEVQVMFGRQKRYFGMEENTSDLYIDLIERAMNDHLMPGNDSILDTGAMVWGKLFQGKMDYYLGIFNGTGNNADSNKDKDVGGRLVGHIPLPFGTIHPEMSFTYGYENESATSGDQIAKFQTDAKTDFFKFKAGTVLDGNRQRYDFGLPWIWGPFSLKGQYTTVTQGMSNGVATASSINMNAWYISASYLLTGEDKPYNKRLQPKHDFDPLKEGWGAWELAGRFSRFNIDSNVFSAGFADPTLYTNKVTAWTIGVNWYPSKNTKMAFDYMRAAFSDTVTIGSEFRDSENAVLLRFQLEF